MGLLRFKRKKSKFMGYKATIILDSLIPYFNKYSDCGNNEEVMEIKNKGEFKPNGFVRVTTLEVTFPRIVLAEQNTHRNQSRNTSSSRAIPTKKFRKYFCDFEPHKFPINCKGMQPMGYFRRGSLFDFIVRLGWRAARVCMLFFSWYLEMLGVHKQIANRLLEPFMWTTVIITATKWKNYFTLRVHKDAQLEIRIPAYLIKRAIRNSLPEFRHIHTPFLNTDDMNTIKNAEIEFVKTKKLKKSTALLVYNLIKRSVARTARGSYLNQLLNTTAEKDYETYDKLISSKPVHASPSESVVMSIPFYEALSKVLSFLRVDFKFGCGGNLGNHVVQYRKIIEDQTVQE